MRSRAVLVVVLVVVAMSAVVAGQVTPGPAQATPPGTDAGSPSGATNTTIAIHPRPNGDARFRVSTAFVLDDANDTTAFRALGREFEEGSAGFSIGAFRRAANESSVVTGRSMNVTNVTRNATIVGENVSGPDTGRLVLGFRWTNFARTNGERLVVGDAFNTTRGTWLPGLTANQTLVIESPPRYTVTRSPVGFTNGTLVWNGPETFQPGTPTAVFTSRASANRTPAPDNGPLASLPPLALGTTLVVLMAAVGAYALTRRETGASRTDEPSTDDAAASDAGEPSVAATPAETELLSDEERVERLLERNDGRMKQAAIVTETGWSNAKVSQLLSAMAEEGRVEKLRIGRENLISLPEEE
ncbi:helix-turn-helix transcriptional regulator [Halococcus sp. AFM35]|uniref:helix-turn-helix transcriptional regulator n=1 Tax=Halococcus sp. AFM35 TaxID=3421653 RepID=UPI003EC02D5F